MNKGICLLFSANEPKFIWLYENIKYISVVDLTGPQSGYDLSRAAIAECGPTSEKLILCYYMNINDIVLDRKPDKRVFCDLSPLSGPPGTIPGLQPAFSGQISLNYVQKSSNCPKTVRKVN